MKTNTKIAEFQKVNELIRWILENERMGTGELYWNAILRRILLKQALLRRG